MSLIRRTNQRTFLDIFPTFDDFSDSISADFSVFLPSDITDFYLKKTYFLLVARYGDTAIVGYMDENRWKLRLFAVLDEYEPEWQQKTEMQKTIRGMDLTAFQDGGKAIYNNALNPNTEPSTDQLEELTYINSQNTTNKKLSSVEAINRKWEMLTDGLNEEYLDHFQKLFSKFLLTDVPLYVYQNEEDDDDE